MIDSLYKSLLLPAGIRFRQRKFIWSAVALVIAISFAGLYFLHEYRTGSVYCVYVSPSGEYRLTVYRFHRFPRVFAVPGDGDGSENPGYVELFDRNGKLLDKADLPTLLDLSDEEIVHWYKDGVSSPGNFVFELRH